MNKTTKLLKTVLKDRHHSIYLTFDSISENLLEACSCPITKQRPALMYTMNFKIQLRRFSILGSAST